MYIALANPVDESSFVYVEDAVPGRAYYCPSCKQKLFARRGEIRHHYFAHYAGTECSDSWDRTYDMSEWHKQWQECFPISNRETVVQLGNIVHRADILVGKTVIEFQHSPMSVDFFNKRSSYYQSLGYKVVWVFDLTDEFSDGKIIESRELSFSWGHPKTTFNNYDLENGQIELFFQLSDDKQKSLVKVKNSGINGFSEFYAWSWYGVDGFLEYFKVGGVFPSPYREDIEINEDYQEFKKKYQIRLDRQQERAVETIDGATLVLAVPGSGKTTTMIARIGYMVNCRGIDGGKILALTYTKNAAKEMKDRYTKLFGSNDSVQFRTINSLAYAIVNKVYTKNLVDEREKSRILSNMYSHFWPGEHPSPYDLKNAALSITCIKNMMLEESAIHEMTIWEKDAFIVYTEYQKRLEACSGIDFDDQLVLAYDILRSDKSWLNRIQNVYSYFCVDEAQDTSGIQYEIIKLMASKSKNIFMVGDEDQSIYAFRGAYPDALLNFKNEYQNPFILRLETNYRSTGKIVDKAATFIAKNSNRYPKEMHSVREEGEEPEVIAVESRMDQYTVIVQTAEKAVESQTAILYRDNVCGLPLVDRMIKRGIPFRLKDTEELLFFFEDKGVADIKAFLSVSINDKDVDSFEKIYYKCNAGIEKKCLKWLRYKVTKEQKSIFAALSEWYSYGNRPSSDKRRSEKFENVVKPLRTMKPSDAIRHVYDCGYGDYLINHGLSSQHIDIMIAIAQEDKTIQDFLKHLDILKSQMTILEKGDEGIVLSTIHSSKGLEYDTVYIMDSYLGMLPHTTGELSEEDYKNYQEERRLFYVAMTRAKNHLYLFRILESTNLFVDELFPNTDLSVEDLLRQNHWNETIGRNAMTKKLYIIKVFGFKRYVAYPIDVETGVVEDAPDEQVMLRYRDLQVWSAYGG